jgi:glycosyltransferase involved in cell wall biosynthesis
MRIGIDVTTLEATHRTGVARYVQNLIEPWSREPRGHEFVAYHSRLAPPDPALRSSSFRLRQLLPLPYVQSYTHPQRVLWEQVALPLAAERDGVEVLFSPGYTAPLRSPCAGVVAIHDISFSVRPEWYPLSARWLLGTFARAAARRREAVLTLSQFSREEIRRVYRIPAERLLVTYLAADPHFRPNSRGEAAHQAEGLLGRGGRFILFVGTMYRRRRVAMLIRAFDRIASAMAGVCLVLVGADPDREAAGTLDHILARDRVVRLPHVSETELRSLYQACSAFVYLSEYEGFGLPVIEAMACAAPVITSPSASLPEVAGDAALFAPLDDEAALAHGLERVLTDCTLEERLRRAGPEQARLFRWDDCATIILDALERVGRGQLPSATRPSPPRPDAGQDAKAVR